MAPCQNIAGLVNWLTMNTAAIKKNCGLGPLLVESACLVFISSCTFDQAGGSSAGDQTSHQNGSNTVAANKAKSSVAASKLELVTEFKVGKKGRLMLNTHGFKAPGDYVSYAKGLSSNTDLSSEMRAKQRMTVLFDRMEGPTVVILEEPIDHSVDQRGGDEKIVKIRVLSGGFSGQEWYVRTNRVYEI